MGWVKFQELAPHTAHLFLRATEIPKKPVLDELPEYLVGENFLQPDDWASFLNDENQPGVTNRELLLRWLITRAIVDQGSDIEGVEMWHHEVFSRAYSRGIRVFHDPENSLSRYDELLQLAHSVREEVVAKRAEIWASASPTRKAGAYTPFNVDGQRGGKQAHWFLSARLFPGLMAALTRSGGLTALVFDAAATETPSEMARRLRNDRVSGLGHAMGDKACDLFAKWAIGTFRLAEGLEVPWRAADCPLPMDQRVGRVMIRCGFMDELFGVVRTLSVKSHGFEPRAKQERPKEGDPVPSGVWHLTVMNFRRNALVRDPHLKQLFKEAFEGDGLVVRKFGPQDAVSAISRMVASEVQGDFSPVVLDDFMMRVAEVCTDEAPKCHDCALQSGCQANNDVSMAGLKRYIT